MARTSGRTPVPRIFADDAGGNSVSPGHDLSWFRRVSHAWSPEDRRFWLWTWFVEAHLRQQRAPKRGAGGSHEGGSGAKKPRQVKVAATTCRHPGCSSHGWYGVPGSGNPVCCPRHTAKGMVRNEACNTLGGRGGGRASGGVGSAGNGGGGGGRGNGGSTTPMDTDEGGDGGDGDGIDGDGCGGEIPMDIGNGGDSGSDGGSGGNGGNSGGSNSGGSDDSDSDDSDTGGRVRGSGGRGRGRGGSRGGRGRGGGGRVKSTKPAAVRQAQLREDRAAGKVAFTGPHLAMEVTSPALPCLKRFLDNNRTVAADRAEEREGTHGRAKKRPAGIGTPADIANIIDLLSESSKDGIEIMEGLYFPRSKMSSESPESGALKRLYDLDYVYDPSNIDVKVGETEVYWGGREQKVASFGHGKYTLEDEETVLTQWELLEARCGDGVTLEQDLARYVRQQGLMHIVTYGQLVPYLSTNANNTTTGMLLDVDGGLARAEASSDGVDSTSKLGTDELCAIKSKAGRVLDFSLKIFTRSSVRDILPIPDPDASDQEGKRTKPVQDFVKRPGSLRELNFIRGEARERRGRWGVQSEAGTRILEGKTDEEHQAVDVRVPHGPRV